MNHPARPTVSVVTVVRDGERFIADAVRSVWSDASTCEHIRTEHVVVNDGSSDGTAEILERLAADVPQLRVQSIPPSGIPIARNTALEMASGEYVAVLDADDIMLPGRLRSQVDFLASHLSHGMVGGQELAYEEATGRARIVRHPISDDALRRRWVRAHVFTHSAIMMRAASLQIVGGYDTQRVHGDEDQHLWIRMARETQVANLDRMVVLRRYHPTQVTRLRPLRDAQLKVALKLMAIRELGLPAASYAQLLWPMFSVLPTRGKRLIRRMAGEHSAIGTLRDFLEPHEFESLPEGFDSRGG